MRIAVLPNHVPAGAAGRQDARIALFDGALAGMNGSVGTGVIADTHRALGRSPIPAAWDLAAVAMAVIAADRYVNRFAVSEDGWTRQIDLTVAVVAIRCAAGTTRSRSVIRSSWTRTRSASVSELATMPWRPVGAWDRIAVLGRHGRDTGPAGLHITPREGLGLATIIARPGRTAELTDFLSRRFGPIPPRTPKAVFAGDTGLVWCGPEQWLLVSESRSVVDAAAAGLASVAAVSDQSDARAILRLAGPSVRQVLAKGCLVDLHPRVFGPGDAAVTAIAHVGAQIWQVDEAPTYDLAVPRSLAASFWTWLVGASGEFGLVVQAACSAERPSKLAVSQTARR